MGSSRSRETTNNEEKSLGCAGTCMDAGVLLKGMAELNGAHCDERLVLRLDSLKQRGC